MTNCKEPYYPYFPATSPIYSKVNTPSFPKSRKWHFRDSKFKHFFGPLTFVLSPKSAKRDSYGTACFCNTSVRKICAFLFVNCVFIGHEIFRNFFRHSEIFGLHPRLYMLATALPPPPRQHFRETFLGALFILKVPLETSPPPPTFWSSCHYLLS
jgi:hypothetical protein